MYYFFIQGFFTFLIKKKPIEMNSNYFFSTILNIYDALKINPTYLIKQCTIIHISFLNLSTSFSACKKKQKKLMILEPLFILNVLENAFRYEKSITRILSLVRFILKMLLNKSAVFSRFCKDLWFTLNRKGCLSTI